MSKKEKSETLEPIKQNSKIDCGLIMPIAPMPGYSSNQFKDVKSILVDTINSIQEYNFNPRLVSDSKGEINIIHKSIVNNIYDDPIVIVDISGKNGNVMLELGLRLAFDKPLIIIKDDKTDYMFDISMIEHLNYPSDLRHNEIESFKKILVKKLISTYKKSIEDDDYSPFLKHFQQIKVKGIGEQNIEQSQTLDVILSKLSLMEEKVNAQNTSYLNGEAAHLHKLNDQNVLSMFNRHSVIVEVFSNWKLEDVPNSLDDMMSHRTKYLSFSEKLSEMFDYLGWTPSQEELSDLILEISTSLLPF